MSLETDILDEIESQGIVTVAQKWIKEWEIARENGLDNTLRSLANMYEIYKNIQAGNKPYLELNHVMFFGQALHQLKQAALDDKRLVKYRFLLPSFEKAYAELVKYVSTIQKTSTQHISKKSA